MTREKSNFREGRTVSSQELSKMKQNSFFHGNIENIECKYNPERSKILRTFRVSSSEISEIIFKFLIRQLEVVKLNSNLKTQPNIKYV